MSLKTRDRILNAALDLFSTQGYAAVRTKGIAEKAGVNETTLFRTFGNKKKLYLETFNRFAIRVSPETILKDIRYNFDSDIPRISHAVITLFLKNSKIIRMSLKDIQEIPAIDEVLRSQPEDLIQLFSGYLKDMQKKGHPLSNPDRLARYYMLTLFSSSFHYLNHEDLYKDYPLDAFVQDTTESFLLLLKNSAVEGRDGGSPQ